MPATALIKFVQGVTTGPNGQSLIGSIGSFTIQNSDNTGVASWQIDLLYVPPGSTVITATPYAFSDSSGTPTATVPADVTGCWRLRLKVWSIANRVGPPTDTDIRVFGIKEAKHGLLVPCPQLIPLPINETNPAKPDEFNFAGNLNGWSGFGTGDGLLNDTLKRLDNGEFSNLPTGTSPQDGFILAWSQSSSAYVLTPRNGLTITSFAHSPTLLEWGQTLTTPAFTASYSTTPNTAFLTNSADGESVNASSTPTSFASTHTFPNTVVNGTVQFFLDATLTGSPAVRATLTFIWGQRSFAGVVAAGSSPATLIAAATYNALGTGRAFSFTLTDDGTHRGQFMYPTRYGSPATVKDRSTGFGVAVTLLGTASRTNAQGKAENYNQYEFVSGFNGTITVDVT